MKLPLSLFRRFLLGASMVGFLFVPFVTIYASDTVNGQVPSASQSTYSFSVSKIVLNNDFVFTATVRNAVGAPLAGKIVQISSNLAMSTVPSGAVTDEFGNVRYTIRFLQTGTAVLSVIVDGVAINSGQTIIEVMNPDVSVSHSSFNFSSNTIEANQDVTLVADIRNAQGQGLGGKLLQVFSDKNVMTSDPPTAFTNSDGIATYKLRFSQVGPVVLTVKVDGMTILPVTTIHVTGSGISVSQSSVSVSASSVPVDPNYGSGVTVTVRNSSGQPMSGKWVTLQASPSGLTTVSPNGVLTNQFGVADFVVKSSIAQTVSLIAYAEGQVLNQQPVITFTGSGSACQFAGYELVKLPDDGNVNTQEDSAVYYYGKDCKRHAFPNAQTYMSWYWDFSKVQIVSAVTLSMMPLGKNVTYRPGVYMVKFPSVPKVYVVGRGGILRWITSEALASTMYGQSWRYLVYDIPESFYSNYTFGADIVGANNFIPNNERDNTPTINDNL